MEDLESKVKLLVKATYLVIALFILNFITVIILYLNPFTTVERVKEKAAWSLKSIETDIPDNDLGERIKYGYQLVTNTNKIVGPLSKTPTMRFAGNNLNCTNCHLNSGRKIGSGSFVGITSRFPQFRGRENKIGTLAERINGCFERSMNGKALDENSKEMQSMIAYMSWLSKDVPEEIEKKHKGYVNINIPTVKADVSKGKALYDIKCIHCHQENGVGMKNAGDEFTGYLYPPLGGEDTYNDGAGMNRVITAAQFIKGNMPFGATYDAPQVTDEEAYNLAAYINTFTRPEKRNKEDDFPNILLKPVSTPYGPWADNFSKEQHKFGPFQPIMSFYKEKYNITKSK